jgi:hypothetical protein
LTFLDVEVPAARGTRAVGSTPAKTGPPAEIGALAGAALAPVADIPISAAAIAAATGTLERERAICREVTVLVTS